MSFLNSFSLFLFLLGVPASVFAGTTYYVAQFQAKVVPNRIFTFVMPEAGELEAFVEARERVEAGKLLAFVNREKLEDEARALELRIARERMQARKEILTLKRRKEEMEFFCSLTEQERATFEKSDAAATADKRALALLEEEISLAETQANASEQSARKEFALKRQAFEMKAPFAGRVEWHFARGDDSGEKIRLYPSVPVLTIADDSDYFIAFPMTRADWARLPKEKLQASIAVGGGKKLSGKFSHARIEKRGNAESLVYFFKLPEAAREDAENLLGSNAIAELFYASKTPLTTLNKAELISGADTEKYADWESLVADKFPGKHIVFNGETTIVLEP